MTTVETLIKVEKKLYTNGAMRKTDFIHDGFNSRTIADAITVALEMGRIVEVKTYRVKIYDLAPGTREWWDAKEKTENTPSSDTHSAQATQ